MNRVILFFFLSLNIQAAPVCGLHEFTYYKNKRKIQEKARTCLENKNKQPLIFSESCLKGKCEAVINLKAQVKELLVEPMGSPHFTKCHNIGGFPIRVVFKDLMSSRKTMICYFKEDNSFLNAEALFLWVN